MAMTTLMKNIRIHGRDSVCSTIGLMRQTTKLFYIIVLLSILVTFYGQICNAQATICNRTSNYTKGSVFERNLNRVFNLLVQETSQTGFNTSTYGQSPNKIYGLLQCRGDTTVDQCYNCSQQATTLIRKRKGCGNTVGGTIWLDPCFLRYENYSFIGKLDSHGFYTYIVGNVSNPDVLTAAAENLLYNLSAEATSGSAIKRFAFGTTIDPLFRRIYGEVQCTRDISLDNCSKCLSDTVGYIFMVFAGNAGVQGKTESCIIRYEMYSFFNSTGLAPPPPEATGNPVANPPPPEEIVPSAYKNTQINNSSNKIPIILGVVSGSLLVLFVCLFAARRRLKSVIFRWPNKGDGQAGEDTLIRQDRQIVVFTMETLVAATENFSDDNKLGEGGFGPVYKGKTTDGKAIAVKKLLSLKSLQGRREFINEIKLVAKIEHQNLVNILGCCAEGSERLLVYEYLPNNSLDKILFDPNKCNQLDWHKRYNIILGVARGLLYLHQESQPRIIHRDIKASNILLDEKLNPKIADFGLARLFHEDESCVRPKVTGTCEYMAPEYAMHGQLSVKTDVYSFGVLLLELIAGRRNTDYSLSSEMQMLLELAWRSYKRGNIVQMIDPAIFETLDKERALKCFHVGLLCTQADSSLRPPMSIVNLMLSSHSLTLPNPTKPAFVRSRVSPTHTKPSGSPSKLSNASASTSFPLPSHILPSNVLLPKQG